VNHPFRRDSCVFTYRVCLFNCVAFLVRDLSPVMAPVLAPRHCGCTARERRKFLPGTLSNLAFHTTPPATVTVRSPTSLQLGRLLARIILLQKPQEISLEPVLLSLADTATHGVCIYPGRLAQMPSPHVQAWGPWMTHQGLNLPPKRLTNHLCTNCHVSQLVQLTPPTQPQVLTNHAAAAGQHKHASMAMAAAMISKSDSAALHPSATNNCPTAAQDPASPSSCAAAAPAGPAGLLPASRAADTQHNLQSACKMPLHGSPSTSTGSSCSLSV
jgi:hypothetical protein